MVSGTKCRSFASANCARIVSGNRIGDADADEAAGGCFSTPGHLAAPCIAAGDVTSGPVALKIPRLGAPRAPLDLVA